MFSNITKPTKIFIKIKKFDCKNIYQTKFTKIKIGKLERSWCNERQKRGIKRFKTCSMRSSP